MKRIVIATSIAALALAGAGAASAKPGQGNGAQKAGLASASGLAPISCSAASASNGSQTATGFVVLNAPGKPGSPRKIVGEVAVKDAAPGTYDVRLVAPNTGSCGSYVGQLVVGANRSGNAAIAFDTAVEGSYHVVLTTPVIAPQLGISSEQYASVPVTLR